MAVLEVLVHLGDPDILQSYSVVSADVPDHLVTVLEPQKIPSNWRQSPAPAEAQAIGDAWVRQRRSAGLRVPSAILDGAYNYLLNPAHPDFADIKVAAPRKFDLDTRLVRRK